MSKEKILITGASGQIGSVLTEALRSVYGSSNVIATDIRPANNQDGPFEVLDALDAEKIELLLHQHKITQIYHLVAILSANGEANPMRTWHINMQSFFNVLEAARKTQIQKIFFPSSIAVFGPDAIKQSTPQSIALNPATVYGITKVAAENWCQYYHQKYNLDIRSLRYPGIISYQSEPGGGTTDYAVDIFHHAVQNKDFTCFLKPDSRLPMIYMPDAVRATLELMEAPAAEIKIRTSYNLSAIDFTPKEVYDAIQKHVPDFKIVYQPDFRQPIADSWPQSIDDSAARNDWGWKEQFNLEAMTIEMIHQLKKKYQNHQKKIEAKPF